MADLYQLQQFRWRGHPRQDGNEKQLVVRIRIAPKYGMRGLRNPGEVSVLAPHALPRVVDGHVEGTADEIAAKLEEFEIGYVRCGSHAQGIRKHVEFASEAGHAQAVSNVVAAAPMLSAGFAVCSELRMSSGEINSVGMRFELGPTREPELASDEPLRVRQSGRGGVERMSLEQGLLGHRRTVSQPSEELLGSLALVLEVDMAVVGRGAIVVGHTISKIGRVRWLAGSRM
nr:hypothetical protein [Variovorax sp. J22R115]